MKFNVKLILLLIQLAFFKVCSGKETLKQPVYETPFIKKANSPLDASFNSRKDLLNASSKFKAAFIDFKDRKISLRSELARGFNMRALNDWVDLLTNRNMDLVSGEEFIEDVSNIKSFSKLLQQWIISKSNKVLSNVALIDMKMKEIDLIEEQLISVGDHQGNINSNLEGNLVWKEKLDEIISNTSSISSEFDVALHGICHVINKIDSFVNSVSKSNEKLKSIENSDPETASDQHEYIIEKKHDVFNSEPNHPLDENQKKTANFVSQLKEYFEDSILSEFEKASADPISSDKEETIIEAVYDEEANLDHLPVEKAKNKVHDIIHKYASDIANRISKKTARKITKNSDLKNNENEKDKKEFIMKTVDKVVKKVVKKVEKKALKKAKGRISAESLIVLSTKNLLKGENINNIVDVVSNLYK